MLESSRDDFETSKNGYDLLQNPIFPEFATKMEHIYHKFIGAYLLLKEPEKTGIKNEKDIIPKKPQNRRNMLHYLLNNRW